MMPRQNTGTKPGYTHNWKYTGRWWEKKTGPGKWIIRFRATKRKREKDFKFAPQRGSKLKWKIVATQYATKTGKGTYQTDMVGKKYLLSARMKNRKRYRKSYSYNTYRWRN